MSTLDQREKRQLRTLWRDAHTLLFFERHPKAARTKAGRRALRYARAELAWTRRELGETRAERRAHQRRRMLSSARPDGCLSALIQRESEWDVHATNPVTGAYGLPQALPGSKMASAGEDWRHNPATQIRWMWGYVKGRYGGSCAALQFQTVNGWY